MKTSKGVNGSTFVECPICKSPGMVKVSEGDDGEHLIFCTNLVCESNGGEYREDALREYQAGQKAGAESGILRAAKFVEDKAVVDFLAGRNNQAVLWLAVATEIRRLL